MIRGVQRGAMLLGAIMFLGVGAGAAQPWRGQAGLEVRVASRQGGDLAGARVELIFRGGRESSGPPAVATDSRGRAVILGLAAGTWQVEIKHPEYMSYVAVVELDVKEKPQITASFLEASADASVPIQVKLLKARGGPASAPLPMIAAVPSETPPPTPQPTPTPAPSHAAPAPANPAPVEQSPAPTAPVPPTAGAPPVVGSAPTTSPPAPTPGPTPTPTPTPGPPPSPTPGPAPTPTPGPAPTPTPSPPAPARPAAPLEPAPEPVITKPPPAEPTPPVSTSVAPDTPPQQPTARPAPAPTQPQPVPPPVAPQPAPQPAPRPEPALIEPAVEAVPPAAAIEVAPPPPTAAPPVAVPAPEESSAEPAVPAAAPSPAPMPAPAPQWRSYRERTCPECRAGEWAVTVAARMSGGSACGEEAADAAGAAAGMLGGRGELELAGFAGPLDRAAGLVEGANGTEIADRLTAARSGGCRMLGIALPKSSRFVGFQYEVENAAGRQPCLPDQPCPGGTDFAGPPRVIRGPAATIIHALAHGPDGLALLTVYFRAPNDQWAPEP